MQLKSKFREAFESEVVKKSLCCFLLNVAFVVGRLCKVVVLVAPYQHTYNRESGTLGLHHELRLKTHMASKMLSRRCLKNRNEPKVLAEATSPRLLMLLNVALGYTRQSFFLDTVYLSKRLF